MVVRCDTCSWEKDVPRRVKPIRALYKCHKCRRPVTSVSVFSWAPWIEEYADRLEAERRTGRLGTRKQSLLETDRDISAAGIGAELAACVLLVPWKVSEWVERAEGGGNNRGCDLPAEWFREGRAVEVKYTAKGKHLLVRPPRDTPGEMRPEMIDDSIYFLMTGIPYTYSLLGWAGRSDLLARGKKNPVPVRGRQRECWGIHCDDLNPVEQSYWVLYRRREGRKAK